MRKILSLFFGFLCIFAANAAQVANVEYVHTLIEQEWDISIPYNSALSDIHTVANMKYLLTAIDVANEILNGEKTTDYGNGEFATLQATDTVATNQAVETLIKKEQKHEFTLTTTADTNSFGFSISAAGEFVVDWGDGTVETITKSDTTYTIYSHDYTTAGAYTIGIGGQATAYNTSIGLAAISFYVINSSQTKIASIDGSLGAIFGTLADGRQPRFYQTFYNASNMKGSIPANLFTGISGAPASYMFYETFYGCSGLTGAIPDGLFAGISGAPELSMFFKTFYDCSGLTTIPKNLFGNISGELYTDSLFAMFAGCTSLMGPSARISGKYLYEIWPDVYFHDSAISEIGPYYQCAGLSDYNQMPNNWKEYRVNSSGFE